MVPDLPFLLLIARSATKFGYSFDRAEVEPCYIQPLLLEAREPSDEEIERGARLQRASRQAREPFSGSTELTEVRTGEWRGAQVD